MSEIYFTIRNEQVLTIRLDPTKVQGQGSPARPILYLPLEAQIMPVKGQRGDVNYTLLRLAGTVSNKGMQGFADFEVGPLAEQSLPHGEYRQLDAKIPLDHARIKQFEDSRSGADAQFSIRFAGLVCFPEEKKFEKISTYGSGLQVSVPRSHWVDNVLSRWGLDTVKLVEIRFPTGQAGENYRKAYTHVRMPVNS